MVEGKTVSVNFSANKLSYFIRLVNQAANKMSNAGCNDFPVPNTDENWRLALDLVDGNEVDRGKRPEDPNSDIDLTDFILLRRFEQQLIDALEPAQQQSVKAGAPMQEAKVEREEARKPIESSTLQNLLPEHSVRIGKESGFKATLPQDQRSCKRKSQSVDGVVEAILESESKRRDEPKRQKSDDDAEVTDGNWDWPAEDGAVLAIVFRHRATVYGGYLRDLKRGAPPNDIDVVVSKRYFLGLCGELCINGYAAKETETDLWLFTASQNMKEQKQFRRPVEVLIVDVDPDNYTLTPMTFPDYRCNALASDGRRLFVWCADTEDTLKQAADAVRKVFKDIATGQTIQLCSDKHLTPYRREKIMKRGFTVLPPLVPMELPNGQE